jgi:hypothetical protein
MITAPRRHVDTLTVGEVSLDEGDATRKKFPPVAQVKKRSEKDVPPLERKLNKDSSKSFLSKRIQ